jgi:hypothetical protein
MKNEHNQSSQQAEGFWSSEAGTWTIIAIGSFAVGGLIAWLGKPAATTTAAVAPVTTPTATTAPATGASVATALPGAATTGATQV